MPDQARALGELRRGGELRFYEHVLSPREPGRRIQRAFDATVWPRMMGGCHLARDTAAAIRAAGFEFRVGPSPAAPHILGAATAPSELDNVPRAPPIRPRMGPVRAG